MKEKEKQPEFRFCGFTDPWEQRKLREISNKVKEKNTKNLYSDTLTNSAEFGIINQRDFFDKDISNEKNLGSYYVVKPDDFVYNPRISNLAPVGPIKRNNLEKTGVMSPLYYVFRIHDNSLDYVETYFSANRWHRYMKLNGDSGARSDRFAIRDSVFQEMPIELPSLPEQQSIGSFFSTLDHLITLQQRELDSLKSLKKTLLSKLFPKNAESFPGYRFQGFNDPWEQRKLKEVARFNPKTELPERFEYIDLESVIGTQLIGHRTEERDSAPSRAQRLATPGDIFFQTVRPYQKNNYLFDISDGQYVFSTGYAQLKPTIDNRFLFSYIQRDDFVKNVLDWCTGTSYPAISSSDLSQISIMKPKNSIEQQSIGSFFSTLDHLITLQQRELEILKAMKKTWLKKLFP